MSRHETNNGGLGKLFYGVILAEHECDFGNVGLDHQRVYSLNYRDIGALVSDYPRVHTIKLLRKNLSPFHRVTRESANRFTTIPARFGQIARDAGEVHIALRKYYDQICQELSRLDGKVEMGFKVQWEVENFFSYFIEQDKTLRAHRDQLMAGGTSLTRTAQIEFGGYVHDRIQQAKRTITEKMLAAMPPGEARVEDVHEDRMITNAQILIRKDLLQPLEETVDALGQTMGDEYSLKLDGPWPPFSFADRLELHLSHL